MEDRRSTRRLKRAELAEASSPTAPKRRRLSFVRRRRRGELFELRSEEREGGPPLLLLPYPDSSEKTSVPSESGEIVSGNFASSLSSSSGPLERPRSSARSDEESADVAEEKFDVVVVDQQHQAKSFETEASTCNSEFSRETTPSSDAAARSATMRPPRAEMESFFSAAEKREQERFAEKYNYDVAMDVPLQGRYEWIRLKP